MANTVPYQFSKDARKAYESLLLPLGIYQLVGNKVQTLLVSDGLCTFHGMTRDELVNDFDKDMFTFVHPDDVERLAKLGLRYATKEGPYDIVYRTKLYGKEEYRYVHAVSKFHGMEDGSRIAITVYTDISESKETMELLKNEFNTPVTRFLDENMGPMVIVTKGDHRLLYYNKAMTILLKPAVNYDSGMTFDMFFYNSPSSVIEGLFDEVDAGLRTIKEPVTGRKLDINVLSCRWEEESAYAVFFYESAEGTENAEAQLRHKRAFFNNRIFAGNYNGLEYYQKGYHGMWLWNLSKDKLISQSGHSDLLKRAGGNYRFDHLCSMMARSIDPKSFDGSLHSLNRKEVIARFKEGTIPKTLTFTLRTPRGQVRIHDEIIMMESPVDGSIFLKVLEENVTESMEMNDVIRMLVEQQYDFIVYLDVKVDHCRIIDGRTDNAMQKDLSVSFKAYAETLAQRIGLPYQNADGFIADLHETCGQSGTGVRTFERADGSVKSITMHVLNEEQEQYFIGVSDVTVLLKNEKQKERELEQARKRAEDADRRKDEFLAKMSHELRTPTGAILSLSAFGIDDCDDPSLNEYFSKIHGSGEYMLSMINDMLDMAKLENGTIALQKDVIHAETLCDRISAMVTPRAMEKEIHFTERHAYPENLYVTADERRVQQVIVNVLNNAVKYTPEGGHVTWTSETGLDLAGQKVIIHHIVDDGVGMSQEFQKHMFEPYTQEYNTETSMEMGTGLGLAIVKKVLDYMHGTILVSSTINQGSSFTLTIPYEPVDELKIQSYQKEHSFLKNNFDFSGIRVLVCEDNVLNQQIEKKILESSGICVDIAENGIVGVEKAQENKYDLIIMDIRMPIMDGFAATREIRQFNPSVPIIALSANAYKEDIQKSLDAGMQAHLVKPINVSEMFAKIAEFVRRKEA